MPDTSLPETGHRRQSWPRTVGWVLTAFLFGAIAFGDLCGAMLAVTAGLWARGRNWLALIAFAAFCYIWPDAAMMLFVLLLLLGFLGWFLAA